MLSMFYDSAFTIERVGVGKWFRIQEARNYKRGGGWKIVDWPELFPTYEEAELALSVISDKMMDYENGIKYHMSFFRRALQN